MNNYFKNSVGGKVNNFNLPTKLCSVVFIYTSKQ